jgi:1,4-dihydroxy-2-naphthoate octaprenyltransferase
MQHPTSLRGHSRALAGPADGRPVPEAASGTSLGRGLARLADPKVSLASFASLFLGACAAHAAGTLHAGWLALTVLGIFAIEVAKNAAGEIYDWDSGVDRAVAPGDRSPFSGGKRVLVDGLLTRGETRGIAVAAYAVGIGCGLAIALVREPAVLGIGLVGVALAFFYHGPPLRLAYRGFGELAVALVYGPLIAAGTVLVQTGRLDGGILLASIPLGLLVAAFLWINEFPDFRADAACDKRNLVVRLGRTTASHAFAGLVFAAFLLLSFLPSLGLPEGILAGWIGAVPALWAVWRLLDSPDQVARIVPAQAMTLLAFLLYALGAGVGWIFG